MQSRKAMMLTWEFLCFRFLFWHIRFLWLDFQVALAQGAPALVGLEPGVTEHGAHDPAPAALDLVWSRSSTPADRAAITVSFQSILASHWTNKSALAMRRNILRVCALRLMRSDFLRGLITLFRPYTRADRTAVRSLLVPIGTSVRGEETG